MSPADRAKAAYAAAEAATHPRDKAALRGAARAWEQLAGAGVPWSHEPAQRALRQLKRDTAMATGPFTAPQAPKAAPSEAELTRRIIKSVEHLTPVPEVSSIQF